MQTRNHENAKPRKRTGFRVFVFSCFRGLVLIALAVSPVFAQSASKPVTFKGLEMSVTGLERAASASLKDCPPGDNRVNAMTRPGEEFAVVTVKFKVLPAFDKSTMLKKPTLTASDGKVYNTAVSFVDVGSVPEFSCSIPFRVPAGTQLKSLQVDAATLDLPK